jgi:hypothetical protein
MHWTISRQFMSSQVQQMHTPFDNFSQVHSQQSKQHSQQAMSFRVQQTLQTQLANSRQSFWSCSQATLSVVVQKILQPSAHSSIRISQHRTAELLVHEAFVGIPAIVLLFEQAEFFFNIALDICNSLSFREPMAIPFGAHATLDFPSRPPGQAKYALITVAHTWRPGVSVVLNACRKSAVRSHRTNICDVGELHHVMSFRNTRSDGDLGM